MENLSQEDFTNRIDEISRNISRIYDEMESDERIIKRIETSKADQIRRLAQYYKEQWDLGVFKDPETGRHKDQHEICRTILTEMDARNFTGYTKHQVWVTLPDDYKRAWRKPIDTVDGKLTKVSLLKEDIEVESVYNTYMDFVNELDNFDYNELPKNLRISLGERFYDMYRNHEKQWQSHGMTFVKHSDGLNIPNPYEDVVKLIKGKPHEDMLFHAAMDLSKTIKDFAKKIKTGVLDENGNRRVSLEDEKEMANGMIVLSGLFKPLKNDKWKRDFLGWNEIFIKEDVLESKSGAAKFSRKKIDVEHLNISEWRGITREEIDKNRPRMMRFFRQFIRHVPALFILHRIFTEVLEEPRAIHSIQMHDKLADSA